MGGDAGGLLVPLAVGPSISTVWCTISCLPLGRSVTSPKLTCERSRLPTGTGAGNRTFSSP